MVNKLNINLLLSNTILYEYKAQADFDIYLLIFLEIEDFRVLFQILKIISQPMVQKITLKKPIQLESGEIVHIRINYTGLFKKRSFVITTIYLAVVHIVLDNNIFKIIILTNSTKKYLEFNKNIRLGTIYKYINITYIIIDIFNAFVVVATISFILSDPFSTVQKKTIFSNRY